VLATEGSSFALATHARERLAAQLTLALRRARRRGADTLATLSLPLPAELDPTAVVCGSRRRGEPWFCFEQPDRGRAALAGLGQAACLEASGPGRFAALTKRWRELSAAAVSDQAVAPSARASALAVGGFAFADDGGGSPHWAGFEPASLIVPAITLAREQRGG
jgi:hypothetical protein